MTRGNLRQIILQMLTDAGQDGMTHAEVRAALEATPESRAHAGRTSVSGTLSNLCAAGRARRVGYRPGPTGRAAIIFAAADDAPRRPAADARKSRLARERRATPLSEEKWPREVRHAVDTLRRRGWSVWPVDADTWEAGGRRTTDQLLDLADRFAPELAEARP